MKLSRALLLSILILVFSSCDVDGSAKVDDLPIETPSQSIEIEVNPSPEVSFEIQVEDEPEPNPEPEVLTIADTLIIGDSNTVRMSMYGTAINDAKHISAIVGVGVCNWGTYKNDSNTTGGATIYNDLDALEDDCFKQVLIMLGTNDYYQNSDKFKNNYLTLIDYLRLRNPEVAIFVGTVPPVRDSASTTIKNSDASRIARIIREIAEQNDLQLIDINVYLEPTDMSSARGDGYHLSRDGAVKLANFLVERLGVNMAL